MSLPGSTVEQLRDDSSRCVTCDTRGKQMITLARAVDDATELIEKQRGEIESLKLANSTLLRRVESLEKDRIS